MTADSDYYINNLC